MKHTFVLFLSLILLVLPGCSAEKSSADTAKKDVNHLFYNVNRQ